MFRSTGQFDKFLDKATSHLLMEPDWKSTLQICDLIRQNDVQPRYALNALRKKLVSQNPHSAMYALMVLESMVKNCGAVVHEELTTKPFCEFLHELAKTTPHENVRSKLLELIQAWNFAFRKNPKHGALKEIMNIMKVEGYKFPTLRESDAMFSADTAPEWADGDVCHRCRVQFTLIVRKHHCRACGQVFCSQCTSKTTTLPKFGIEKDVRVCDSCFDQATKPSSSKPAQAKSDTELTSDYLKNLGGKTQDPPKKNEDELREEEELQLAIALSKSEAEAKEKANEKRYSTSTPSFKTVEPVRPATPEEQINPELQKYLNRSYWESLQNDKNVENTSSSPSAPASAPIIQTETKIKTKENGVIDNDLEEFIRTLKGHVEIFINRMKSNSSRGRSIANDSSVQTLFMNITAMHSKLLHYIQEHDDKRIHFERLQDKLTQVKDARAALDALREEHREKLRLEAEEAERQRQMQMAHKLEIMRKKKQEYLQYQRQLALQRIQEQEREMHMRQEQQKQQYMIPQYGYIGPAVHGQQFPPNSAPPPGAYHTYPYPQHLMSPSQAAALPHQNVTHTNTLPSPAFSTPTTSNIPPPGMPPQQAFTPRGMPQPQPMMGAGMRPMGMPPGMPPQPQNVNEIPQNGQMMPPQQGPLPPHFMQQGTAPIAAPPQNQTPKKDEAQTAELISFD